MPAIGCSETLQFVVDSANIGTIYQGGDFDLTSTGLDGTILSGQNLTLSLVLSNDVLARLFLSDPNAFGVELTLDTNAMSDPGFAGATTGYLLNPNGNQLGGSQVAGRSDASDGTFSVGLVSFTTSNLGGTDIVDISGAQFDTTLPADGFVVTGARLRFSLNSNDDGIEFGTAQELPEGSSTLVFTLVDLLVLAFAVGYKALKRARLKFARHHPGIRG